jgi:uncharacterized membrane protein YoaT (DUF817 family)
VEPGGRAASLKSVAYLSEFFVFGLKEARACIFAGSFFALLFLSNHAHIPGLARYDLIFLGALLLQLVLYLTKVETTKEVAMIFLFHLVGLALELYKTNPAIGSWSYPEPAFFKLGTVPLYSGFMYAAVGSYISQAWRIFKLELSNLPRQLWSLMLGLAIYINFFTNHFVYDVRLFLIAAVFALYYKTRVYFTVTTSRRYMPLPIAFVLIAFFIWVAENISTFLGAWQYPDQVHVWNVVSTNKITSWFLLVIICFIIVSYLKHARSATTRP